MIVIGALPVGFSGLGVPVAVPAVPLLRAVVQGQSTGRVFQVFGLAPDVERDVLGGVDRAVLFECVLGFPVADCCAGVVDDVDVPVEVCVSEGRGGDWGLVC